MVRHIVVVLAAAAAPPPAPAPADVRVVALPLPEPEDGKVPSYEWSVDWALRDDEKPSMGSLSTYKTFAAARAAADAKLASNRVAHGDGKDPKVQGWTWVKYVQITGAPRLSRVEDLPPKARRVWGPILAGLEKKTDRCNFLVRDIGAAAKAPGLAGRKADELWGYFNTTAGEDGWERVDARPAGKDGPAASAVERANQLAADGYLVIGVTSSDELNKALAAAKAASPKNQKLQDHAEYTHGHVFAVAPAGGGDWPTTMIANAGNGSTAALVAADTKVVPVWQRTAYQFFAIKLAGR
ncbi:MAG: hypothetical protein C0501_08655 [Isosphaera sp.]|nr:hypothetical protein [Isosphaera sp.]